MKAGHRFHVVWQFKKTKACGGLSQSKSMSMRGKYRSAHAKIDDVRLSTALWVDSSLVATISADLGTEVDTVKRRRGRHKRQIKCPRMVFLRGKMFRAVDIHDMLRLGKVHFLFSCKKKAWPKLFFGLIEVLLVNIYIVVVWTNPGKKDMSQSEFRWQLVEEFVREAERLEKETDVEVEDASATATVEGVAKTPFEIRMEGRDGSHHHDIQPEYVPTSVAAKNQRVVDASPSARPTKRKKRRRDHNRLDGKVLNPFHTSLGVCVVCKFFFKRNKPTKTARYCRECVTDPEWPETCRAKGWQTSFHPRLCSTRCFDIFHTTRMSGLDFRKKKRRCKPVSSGDSVSGVNPPSHMGSSHRGTNI